MTLGIDTSNYTTSAAVYSPGIVRSITKPLSVEEGTLGLRQSDAVFQHVKSLPEVIAAAVESDALKIKAIGVSSRPRAARGSYMPCFIPGLSFAKTLASVLDVPLFEVSHQQGHIAAATYSAGCPELLDGEFLAWHLSGGTTELLLVHPDCGNVTCEIIGGTTDISAGRLIDRAGKQLALPFPSGKALDSLAEVEGDFFRVKIDACYFSLSGVENKIKDMGSHSPAEVATFTMHTISNAVFNATVNALGIHGKMPILFSGGVASSGIIRSYFRDLNDSVFAPPEYSTDNAFGAAVLANRLSI